MKAFVTGGTGFIGAAPVRRLVHPRGVDAVFQSGADVKERVHSAA